MEADSFHPKHKSLTGLNIVSMLMSVYVIIAVIIEFLFEITPQLIRLLHIADAFVCLIFILDFIVNLKKADSKKHYLINEWGWVDLITSIPAIGVFSQSGYFQIIRVLRIFRAFRSSQQIIHYLFRSRIQSTFTAAIIAYILLVIFSSIAILEVEEGKPGSTIKTAEDALWWAYVTVTTVGYGDMVPVTTLGRMIAAVLMTAGVGMFGTFTAWVSSWFIQHRKDKLH